MRGANRIERLAIAVYDLLMSPRKSWIVSIVVALAISACGVGASPVSRDVHDPSSPEAAGGVDPLHAPTPAAVASATTYACPMHPDVTASAPGSCPKCRMTLVPQK